MSEVYFSIDQTPEGGLQLSINGGGTGYRICGPKYDGRSKTVGRHKLTERDVMEIRFYLRKVSKTASQGEQK